MGLKDEFLKYLTVAKKDANKNDKVLLGELRGIYYRKKILDTVEFAMKIAGLVELLYFFMPEIKKADPKHVKIMPLCAVCNRIEEESRRSHKHRRR
ncbi:MAG: hypothetical protein V4501_08745 [Pseudomonadota bacterium]